MPELPEVETLHRQLKKVIAGAEITHVIVMDAKLGMLKQLEGKSVVALYRKGKGLNILLDDDHVLTIHLRMTGRLFWQEGRPREVPHTRLKIHFPQGRLDLIDPRRFATVAVQNFDRDRRVQQDPEGYFSPRLCFEQGKNRRLPIKAFLMDQRFIAGIGNIYACEILYRAGISPLRQTRELSLAEWKKIHSISASVLTCAVNCRGTTVSDWCDLYGETGEYQHHLQVYKRSGLPCPRCGATIERCALGGRGTYYCPSCQS